jgi:hypothetical protein
MIMRTRDQSDNEVFEEFERHTIGPLIVLFTAAVLAVVMGLGRAILA